MIAPWELVLRLAVAAILGALVGLERERLEWAAGMRTHALVSLGSALFMVVSIFGFSDILNERHVILDPSRVAAQVASGIGFIGAGTIIFRREVVKGLDHRGEYLGCCGGGACGGRWHVPRRRVRHALGLGATGLGQAAQGQDVPRPQAGQAREAGGRAGDPVGRPQGGGRGVGGAPGAHRGSPELGRLGGGRGGAGLWQGQPPRGTALADGRATRVSGVREVSSALANGSAESKPKQ